MLCTPGAFSTTTSWLFIPSTPSSAIALWPSASSLARYAGSTQARATTRAPFSGPTSFSYSSTSASTASVEIKPFSTSSDSIARARSAGYGSGSGLWCPWLKVALPQIDVDDLTRLGGLAPQLGGVEAHAVERLGARPAPVRAGVRQRVVAVESVDDAALAARVAGQAGVAPRVDVAGHDRVASREARRRALLARRRARREAAAHGLARQGRLVAPGRVGLAHPRL